MVGKRKRPNDGRENLLAVRSLLDNQPAVALAIFQAPGSNAIEKSPRARKTFHTLSRVNLFALAIRTGLSAHDLKEMVFSYPTGASDVRYMI